MQSNDNTRRRGAKNMRQKNIKSVLIILCTALLLTAVVCGVIAFIVTNTGTVKNTFTPSKITTEITEEFDGQEKKNVNAKNTGDIDAYIRIKLVTYRVNENGDRIGGTAEIPKFAPGADWVEKDGFYYYTLPVAPDDSPATALIDSIKLAKYDDADGGVQVIEVMAEAIQSTPDKAVGEAWGVSISRGSVTDYTA